LIEAEFEIKSFYEKKNFVESVKKGHYITQREIEARASKAINVKELREVLGMGCTVMNECLAKAAQSWNKGDLELNEASGDVMEAISYIKNTSSIYLEFT